MKVDELLQKLKMGTTVEMEHLWRWRRCCVRRCSA